MKSHRGVFYPEISPYSGRDRPKTTPSSTGRSRSTNNVLYDVNFGLLKLAIVVKSHDLDSLVPEKFMSKSAGFLLSFSLRFPGKNLQTTPKNNNIGNVYSN
uniref:Uncharacterized protein n=1 Tax=Cacopsylla melanoneura TaxID=428564 RepID=A0A8D8YBR1_9HEMI